jgi:alanine-synthesizing transaminase
MAEHAIRAAQRTRGITYAIRDILIEANQARAQGKELLYLNIGDPNKFDFDTPPYILEAIKEALDSDRNGYAPSDGYPESLEAVRRWAGAKGIRNIQDVFIGHGASEPIEIALTALVDRGENVLTPAPGYPLYTAVMAKLEAEENPYYLDEGNGWQPDPDDVEARINPRTRAVVLINPNNPTGSVCSREVLERILEIAARHRLVVFADEIYDRLVFDGATMVSIAALRDDVPVITFGGLAKVFIGPGLRIGWAVTSGPAAVLKDYVGAMQQLTRARICANSPIQCAVPRALAGPLDYLDEYLVRLKRRRDLTVRAMNDIPGISCVEPKGAFYCFPRIEAPGVDDKRWVTELIHETGVVVVHGSGFRQRPGTAHFRIVYLPPEDVLERAYAAIARFMRRG